MKFYADIIIRPLITEKSMDSVSEKRYCFEVAKVNTINMKKKPKRYGVHFGYTGEWKKAIVTLTEDSAPIAFFDSMS